MILDEFKTLEQLAAALKSLNVSVPTAFLVAASNASIISKARANYVCDGTADDVQIQAAIDALPSGGGKVQLSEGTFNISTQILMDDDQTLEGVGTATILFLVASTNKGLIRNINWGTDTENYRLAVRNLAINGNKANNASDANDGAISLRSVVDVWVQNVWVKDFRGFAGIYVAPYGTQDPVRCHITDCHVQDCVGTGSYGCGIYVTGATYHGVISGCTLDGNSGYGLMIEDNCANLTVSNCMIKDAGNRGILVNKSDGVTITNCIIENATYDGIETSDSTKNLTISNCVIFDCGQAGIYCQADVANQSDLVISNCILYDNASSGWAGIVMTRSSSYTITNVTITGNRCFGTQDYAVRLYAGINNVVIQGNNFMGNVGESIIIGDDAIDYSTDITRMSAELDLSGAASDVDIFHATMPCQLVGYEILYTEASSADAGVTIRIGRYEDGVALTDNYFDSVTSEVSENLGYSKVYITSDLTKQQIDAGMTVTVGTAGSKTGTGNVRLILKIAEMAEGYA